MYGLILGLSSGTACLSSCAPIMLPYMLRNGRTVKRNYLCLLQFLSGRLIGYICIGLLAGLIGKAVLKDAVFRNALLGVSYTLLGAMLIFYNLKAISGSCALKRAERLLSIFFSRDSLLYPVLLGLVTGINICPPFLVAFTEAASSTGILESVLFFITFFIGTSVFFLPLPFLGLIRKKEAFRIIGELTLYIIAAYYILRGILSLGGLIL